MFSETLLLRLFSVPPSVLHSSTPSKPKLIFFFFLCHPLLVPSYEQQGKSIRFDTFTGSDFSVLKLPYFFFCHIGKWSLSYMLCNVLSFPVRKCIQLTLAVKVLGLLPGADCLVTTFCGNNRPVASCLPNISLALNDFDCGKIFLYCHRGCWENWSRSLD